MRPSRRRRALAPQRRCRGARLEMRLASKLDPHDTVDSRYAYCTGFSHEIFAARIANATAHIMKMLVQSPIWLGRVPVYPLPDMKNEPQVQLLVL